MTDNIFYSIISQCMPEYNIVENIGSGTFGSVYKCERDGIYYAIKIISVPANENELKQLLSRADKDEVREYLHEKVEKYRREIMLMAELKGNRSIVNIEDYKVLEGESGLWYIVIRMELLTSLPQYVSKHDMDEKEIIRLGIDMCDALTICEKHDIIHRDIKPENILHHNEGAFKLGDFGVAKQLSKTTAGTIAGTEGFMAPEVYKGQEYNHTADIYSLGVLLYYYLNNKKMPFVEPNDKSLIAEQEAIERRMNDQNILPLPPKASENLGKIIVKACMYNKDCRYQSAADMRVDLMKVLRGEKVDIDFSSSNDRGTIAQLGAKRKNDSHVVSPFTNDMIDNDKSDYNKNGTEEFGTVEKKKKKKGLVAVLCVVCAGILAAGGFVIYQKFFAGPEPGIYLDENGNQYEILSKEAMEEAYNLGVQYAEQGEYQEAIEEFNKVSSHSGKYKEAQDALEKAKTDYQDSLIEKANTYTGNKDYDMAFSMIDTGIAALGDNEKFKEAKESVLAALKVDYVARAEEQEKSENYDKSLECINLVLTYIPDDYELKGMQSRVNAANVAKKALEKAEEHKYKSEYAKLFSSLDKAMDEVADSTTATATLKMAYDNYMTEYLELIETQTSDLETVSDYENAVKILESAVEIFPNDYDLKKQLAETTDMKVAVTAVTDADNYAKKNDYTNLFKALTKALDSLSSVSDAGKKVQNSYDKYFKTYMEQLDEKIGTPKSVAEYDAAIKELETATKIFPDDSELKDRLSEMKSSKPVSLFSLDVVETKGYNPSYGWSTEYSNTNYSGYDLKPTSVKDIYGNTFTSAAIMYTTNNHEYHRTHILYLRYDVDKYNKLTGGTALWDKAKSFAGYARVTIYGCRSDGTWEEIYYRNMSTIMKPEMFEVNISKYSLVEIRFGTYINSSYDDTDSYNGGSKDTIGAILYDFTLSK